MTSKQKYTVDEILSLVEGDNSVLSAKIYLCPPTNCYNSDEDSGDEDGVDINRLTKHQLLADAEANVKLINEGEIISELITVSNSVEPELECLNTPEFSGSPTNNAKTALPAESVTTEPTIPKPKTPIDPHCCSSKNKSIDTNLSLPSTSASPSNANSTTAAKKSAVPIEQHRPSQTTAFEHQNKSKKRMYNKCFPLSSASSMTSSLADDQPSAQRKRKLSNESEKPFIVKPTITQSKTEIKKKDNKEKKVYKWAKKDVESKPNKEWELPQWLSDSDRSPVELFELFYDDELINLICDMTNKYSSEKGEPAGYTTADIKCFIGILLVSGYAHVPRIKMYWETKDDVWNKAIAEAMPRNKFLSILRSIHVCDNTNLDQSTKFAKIAPLWKMINERWLKFFPGDANLSIDESMIPYYGRHSAKQHIHGKPIRFGYKAWCLCTRFGYLAQAIPYEGASTKNMYPHIGVGGSVIMELSEKLPPRIDGYNLFFDNFFTSVILLETLKTNGNTGTGTVKANRVCKAPLIDVKLMRKEPRGAYEQLTEEKSGITLVRYNDNNVVTVASTYCGVEPIGKVRRYSAAEKKHITVPQPACIAAYNQYMGGVDRLDENISKYRIGIRGKKWYWQLIAFPINVSVNNAWVLYRSSTLGKENPLDLLSFTREITLTYLKKYSSRLTLGRPLHYKVGAVDKRVTADVRYDNEGHLIGKSDKQTRCAQCKKNSTMKCIKCNLSLHSKCFVPFHSK